MSSQYDRLDRLEAKLADHLRVLQLMYWDDDARARGPFWVLMTNVFVVMALEQRWRAGLRAGAMHANATAINLVKRLTRALDAATDPFDSTPESRLAARVRFGL